MFCFGRLAAKSKQSKEGTTMGVLLTAQVCSVCLHAVPCRLYEVKPSTTSCGRSHLQYSESYIFERVFTWAILVALRVTLMDFRPFSVKFIIFSTVGSYVIIEIKKYLRHRNYITCFVHLFIYQDHTHFLTPKKVVIHSHYFN